MENETNRRYPALGYVYPDFRALRLELPTVPGTGGRGAAKSWMDDPETRGGYTISTRAEGA